LASLSLTHVHYVCNPGDKALLNGPNTDDQDANDPISHACAWLALVPQVLCIVYVTLIWSTREAEVLLMFAGQMGCEALNWVLKRVLKEERPRRECCFRLATIKMQKHVQRLMSELQV